MFLICMKISMIADTVNETRNTGSVRTSSYAWETAHSVGISERDMRYMMSYTNAIITAPLSDLLPFRYGRICREAVSLHFRLHVRYP